MRKFFSLLFFCLTWHRTKVGVKRVKNDIDEVAFIAHFDSQRYFSYPRLQWQELTFNMKSILASSSPTADRILKHRTAFLEKNIFFIFMRETFFLMIDTQVFLLNCIWFYLYAIFNRIFKELSWVISFPFFLWWLNSSRKNTSIWLICFFSCFKKNHFTFKNIIMLRINYLHFFCCIFFLFFFFNVQDYFYKNTYLSIIMLRWIKETSETRKEI